MKRPHFLCAFIAATLLLCFPANAQSYTDYMKDLDNSTIKTYQNLQSIATSNIPPLTKDRVGIYALTFQNPGRPQAAANYRVQGGESVTVELYTWLGTFACALPGQPGSYAAGMPQASMGHIYTQQLYPLLLGSNGMTYAYIGGDLYKLTSTTTHFALLPTGESSGSAGGFVNYGLNVYAGDEGGSNMRKVDMVRSRSETIIGSDWVYEKFTGSLPASAAAISVEINDFSTMDLQKANGTTVPTAPGLGMRTILKQVTFNGSSLTVGIPEPVTVTPSSSSEKTGPGSSSLSSSSKSSSSKKASSTAAAGTSSYNSSKFSGEVTSIIPGDKPASTASSRAAKKAASVSSSQAQQAISSTEEALPNFKQDYPDIIRISPTSAAGGPSATVSIYIAVMVALILVLLLRKK